jgi:hypothetical protein
VVLRRVPHVAATYRPIEVTDADTDALVYELYGLTEEEIAIVEGQEHSDLGAQGRHLPGHRHHLNGAIALDMRQV